MLVLGRIKVASQHHDVVTALNRYEQILAMILASWNGGGKIYIYTSTFVRVHPYCPLPPSFFYPFLPFFSLTHFLTTWSFSGEFHFIYFRLSLSYYCQGHKQVSRKEVKRALSPLPSRRGILREKSCTFCRLSKPRSTTAFLTYLDFIRCWHLQCYVLERSSRSSTWRKGDSDPRTIGPM